MRTYQTAVAGVVAVTLGLGLAYTARVVTAPERLPFAEVVPGPNALPLTQTVELLETGGHPGFTLRAPETAVVTVRDRGPDRLMFRVRGGSDVAGALIIHFPDVPADPVKALRAIKLMENTRLGPIRRTTVGGAQAAVADMTIGTMRVVREYRFVRDGRVYGFGLIANADDTVSLDTGDAMVASWEWA